MRLAVAARRKLTVVPWVLLRPVKGDQRDAAAMRRRPFAKLSVPRLFSVVPRERLFTMLDDASERAVTWISGPPGAGKTTLVASWLESRERRVAWYSIDSGDDDPGTFFHYLSLLLGPRAARAHLPPLTPESLARPLVLARVFFRKWFAALPDLGVVVFDNFQEASSDAPLAGIAQIAADELPDGLHLVFVSRTGPPESFVRLRAARQMTEIGWDCLQFTLDETRQMSDGHPALSASTVRLLHERCNGWAAGVTLMLERIARTGVLPETAETETREAVFAYFAGVMLARLGEEERRVLFSVCAVPAVDRTAAQVLSGTRQAGQVLEDLHRRNFFTVRQHAPRASYRFHPLFREFLELRAREVLGEAEWQASLCRAAVVLDTDGQTEDAFALFCRAGDWEAAAQLVLRRAPVFTAQGRGLTVRDWIGHLPEALTRKNPWFDCWMGVALTATDANSARPLLAGSYEAFLRNGDRHGALLAATRMLAAIIWTWHDYRNLQSWKEIMEWMLADPPPSVTGSEIVSAYGYLVQGAVLGSAPGLATRRYVERLLELLEAGDAGVHERLEAGAAIGKYLYFVPDSALLARLRRLIPALRQVTDTTGFRWMEWASACAHALQRDGDFDLAECLADESVRLHPRYVSVRRTLWLLLVKCLIQLASGRLGDVARTFGELTALSSPGAELGVDHFRLQMQSILDLADGKVESACALALQAAQAADDSGFAYIRLRSRPQLAVALVHAGRTAEAFDAIATGRRLAEGTAFWYADIELTLTEAYVLLVSGRRDEARLPLGRALVAARERSDTWDFLDFAVPFARSRLYAFALQEGLHTDLVKAIICRHRVQPGPEAGPDWPWPLRIRTLGGFEVTVLGQPLRWGRKVPRKMLEMLKVLVASGSENVPEATLCDALWPEEDGDVAHGRYGVMLLRLRRLLGDSTLLRQENGCLSLDLGRVWVDVHRLAMGPSAGREIPSYEFLPEVPDVPWARAMRKRLQRMAHLAGDVSGGASRLEANRRD